MEPSLQPELRIPPVDFAPLTVVVMLADGTSLKFFELREFIKDANVIGTWRAPFIEGETAAQLIDSMDSALLSALVRVYGDVVALGTSRREGSNDLLCTKCWGAKKHICAHCKATGRVPWPS